MSAPRRPHVVMLVGNDITVDTRVKKTAASLVRHGFRVTVLGYSSTVTESAEMAGASIRRVPIPWTHKTAGRSVTPEEIRAAGLATPDQLASDLRSRVSRGLERRQGQVIRWGTRSTRLPRARKVTKVAGLQALRFVRSGALMVLPKPPGAPPPGTVVDPVLPWRTTVPIALDYTEALTPHIVALAPDVIHAHDVHTIGAAEMARRLFADQGKVVPWVYDAHEFIAGLSLYGQRDAVERAGWLSLEQEFAPAAAAIITVSPVLADELTRRYPGVPVRVVLNAPWHEDGAQPRSGGVRDAVGLERETPLLVYSGVVTDARGVATAVEAMPALPGVHLAIVSTTLAAKITQRLTARAEALGVSGRVSLLPPVPAHEVVAHLASADVGLIPLLRYPSHDVALTNKLFEYIHAGLPVVVSDCPAQAEFVRSHEIGAVHAAQDAADLALAVRETLHDLAAMRAAVRDPELARRYSWQASEADLGAVYRDVLGLPPSAQPDPTAYPSLAETYLHREEAEGS